MRKRRRRTLKEIRNIREQILDLVRQKERLTLSQLVSDHGDKFQVRNTASDRRLVKLQLSQLSDSGAIEFVKVGRNWIARNKATVGRDKTGVETDSSLGVVAPELEAIRAYAIQLEQFAKSLQEQIGNLVRMLEKATD